MRHIKLNRLLITLTSILLATAATAGEGDYQSQVSYEYMQRDYSGRGVTIDQTLNTLTFKHHPDMVNTTNIPLAEAELFARSARLEFQTSFYGSEDNDGDKHDGNYQLFRYVHMQPNTPLYFSALYYTSKTKADLSNPASTDYTYSQTGYEIGIGYFIAKYTIAGFFYEESKTTYTPAANYSGNNDTDTELEFAIKHLVPMSGQSMLGLHAVYLKIDNSGNKYNKPTSNDRLVFIADYYFNKSYSIGMTLDQISGSNNGSNGDEKGIRGQFFFTPKFSLLAELKQFTGSGKSYDKDTVTLQAALRF